MTVPHALRRIANWLGGIIQPVSLPGKLLLSHLSVASVGLAALLIAFVATNALKGTIDSLVTNASPKAVSSAMAMTGVQKTMAWLRLSFSGEAIKGKRRIAWKDDVWPAIATVLSLADEDDRKYIDEIIVMTKQLEVEQWWVEDSVTSIGNVPADLKLMEELLPRHNSLVATLDTIVADLETGGQNRELLKPIFNMRSDINTTYLGLHDYVDTAEQWTRRDITGGLARIRAANEKLLSRPVLGNKGLDETIGWVVAEVSSYDRLVVEVMELRQAEDWNKARWMMQKEVIPLSLKLTQALGLLSHKYSEAMQGEARRAMFMSVAVTSLVFILMLLMIVAAVGMSRRNSVRITMPVEALAVAADEMAAGRSVGDISVETDDEIGRLTRVFNRMRSSLEEKEVALTQRANALEKANKEMESFIYSISHDLKVPMITIQGMAKLLEREFGEGISKDSRTYFDYIFGASATMSDLLDDLLEMSRVGRMDVNPDVVDMDGVVKKVFAESAAFAKNKSIIFEAKPELPAVYANKKRIYQTFSNLITNAVKFMPADVANPVIEIGWRPSHKKGMVEYFVKDNGAGIDPKYHDKIFTLFHRLHGKEIEGTGMGLAFVKKILENMEGDIRVESEPGKGAAFYLTLPQVPEGL